MSGRKTHTAAGLLVSFFLLLDLASKGPVLSPIIPTIALVSSMIGSVLPDIIEPPRNRRHRKFFHSLFFLALLLAFLHNAYALLLTGGLSDEVTFVFFFAGAGYASHLVLDALTPSGLPVVGL
ncbi:metal-dependent hydrolase [Methanosarcina hadiensis]|uniref:metal-dependent hydrolase n=1 Tax=Methanosarcina hadiensis TaxID=3078083 RepID=UPI003977C86F